MKIQFKTLSGAGFNLAVEKTDTIGIVKKKIEEEHKYASNGMKIIFNGKILSDNTTIDEAGIKDQNFLVIVAKKLGSTVAKKKPRIEETKPVETKEEQKPSDKMEIEQPKPTKKEEETKKEEPKKEETKKEETKKEEKQHGVSDIAMGDEYNRVVQQFIEMGFEKTQIEKCMRAAFLNPERAAEYLMSGIPPHLEEIANRPQRPTQQTTTQQPTTQQQTTQQQTTTQQSSGLNIDDIRQAFPQFDQLRAAIQQNPDLLQPILSRLAQQNPDLIQMISQNQEEFIRLLNEPVTTPTQQQQQQQEQGQRPRAPGAIFITPEEKEAVDRLVAMGFDKVLALQAYFACDKDENLAANFLLQQQEEDWLDEEQLTTQQSTQQTTQQQSTQQPSQQPSQQPTQQPSQQSTQQPSQQSTEKPSTEQPSQQQQSTTEEQKEEKKEDDKMDVEEQKK